MQIPVNKLLQGFLKLAVVRPGLKEARIHTQTVARNDVLIFQGCVMPKPSQLFLVVVFTFNRITTHKPNQLHIGLGQ
jgi:hypothetical protein